MRGVRLMSGNFVFLAGTYLSFKTRGLQTYWRFGELQWVAEAQIQSNSRFSKFLAFRGQHRPPALRFVQFTAPSRHGRACQRHPRRSSPLRFRNSIAVSGTNPAITERARPAPGGNQTRPDGRIAKVDAPCGLAKTSNSSSQLPRQESLEKQRSSMLRALRPISAPRCGSRAIERIASAKPAPSPGVTTIPQSWRSTSVAISPAGSQTAIVGRPAATIP